MKRRLLSLLILLSSYTSFAQINYQKDYATALKNAQATKTPIFILFSPQINIPGMSFETGLDKPEAVEYYNKHFTSFRVLMGSPEAKQMSDKYQITRFPHYIFLDPNERVILKAVTNNREAKYYMDLGTEVSNRFENGTALFNYDIHYADGKRSKEFFKDYINLRIRSGYSDNAKFIDEYVKTLTIGEFEDREEILFILRAGPIAYGKAYTLIYANAKLTNEIFMSLPAQERININNVLVDNTMKEAIATRNIQMAQSVSNIMRNIHKNNYEEGQRQASWKMITYYKAIRDTSNFFRSAIAYNDRYYMNVSLDSVKRANAKTQGYIDLIKNSANMKSLKRPSTAVVPNQLLTTYSKIVTVSTSQNTIANLLNTAAWDFYELGTTNNNNLTKALLWSKRSIEMHPNPAYYDTIAHIFYRLGLYDEAIINQNKSIQLSLNNPQFKGMVANSKIELEKMKTRKL